MQGVSIILCCYNSSTRLPQTIHHLAKQKISQGLLWEIIVVDNASTDATSEVAHQLWGKYCGSASFHVVNEKKPGLSYARKRGVKESKFNTLIFCDDDNWLSEDYVEKAYNFMKCDDKKGILGGYGTPVFDGIKPGWFDFFKSFYAVGVQDGSTADDLNGFHYLYGAGMVVNKLAWEELYLNGFESLTTDRIGNKLVSGGDTELCFAMQVLGYSVEYNSALSFQHFIPASRLKFSYCTALTLGIGYSSDLLFPYRKWFDPSLKFPFPTLGSTLQTTKVALRSLIILIIPMSRYGHFYQKLRNAFFLLGKLNFQISNQNYFLKSSYFLESR